MSDDTPQPFRALGHAQGYYYFLAAGRQEVEAYSAAQLGNKAILCSLADQSWWEVKFPGRSGFDSTAAANDLMRQCEAAGLFDPDRVRGRGAWYDRGQIVLHLGRELVIDGQRTPMHLNGTAYVYEQRPPMEADAEHEPATASEANQLRSFMQRFNWSRPIEADLLAGWCMLSVICGALRWRPHVWLTGPRGSGKSYIFSQVVQQLLGHTPVIVQGNSTEAGIRQKLANDARPVVFDEAEAENQADQRRVQGILELARQASSEHSAEIAKGTTGGRALSFRVRSMFLFGSINVTLSRAADESRFTILSLLPPPPGKTGAEQLAGIEAEIARLLTDDYCARLRVRAYRMIPTIRTNAQHFARAVAEHLGNQRIGDQLGTLLAGAYALYSDDVFPLGDARAWVAKQQWEANTDADSDESRCLAAILQAQVRVETYEGKGLTRSIAELLESANGQGDLERLDADQALARHGLRVNNGFLYVANSHQQLRRILADTPYAGGWSRILARVNGAESIDAMRFSGQRCRAVALPLSAI